MSKRKLAAVILLIVMIISYYAYRSIKTHLEVTEVKKVVSEYLEYSSSHDWEKAETVLTGEALAETMRNSGSVKDRETIIRKDFSAQVDVGLAVVDADVTKTGGKYDDRVSYRFNLIKTNNDWKIYKVSYKRFERPPLFGLKKESGVDIVNEYLSLNYKQRSENAEKYLSGDALAAALKNRFLPKGDVPEVKERVISLKPIGSNGSVSTVEAVVEVEYQDVRQKVTSLIDTVMVNNTWKIVNIDVVEVN